MQLSRAVCRSRFRTPFPEWQNLSVCGSRLWLHYSAPTQRSETRNRHVHNDLASFFNQLTKTKEFKDARQQSLPTASDLQDESPTIRRASSARRQGDGDLVDGRDDRPDQNDIAASSREDRSRDGNGEGGRDDWPPARHNRGFNRPDHTTAVRRDGKPHEHGNHGAVEAQDGSGHSVRRTRAEEDTPVNPPDKAGSLQGRLTKLSC